MLGISCYFYLPIELKKQTTILLCFCCLDFKLNSSLLQCSRCVQSKTGVDLVEVSVFYKLEKISGQTVWPIKIKTVALLYFIIAASL